MIKYLTVLIATIVTGLAVSSLWECNYCHQQYIGNSPPHFVKCPAKDNKVNHWWIRKNN